MNIEMAELNTLLEEVMQIKQAITDIEMKIDPQQQWFDLKNACRLKGVNYNTVVSKPKLQPNRGEEDGIIAGRRRWRRETILEWINQTDEVM